MKFDPQKHQRTSTRMKGYDYSAAGAYFVTLVTYQRAMLFGEIENGVMRLSRHGQIVHEEWFRSAEIRKEIRLYQEEFVVMPNHVHGIVWIVEDVTHHVGADGIHPIEMNKDVEADGIPTIEVNNDADGIRPIDWAHGRAPLRLHRKPKSLSSFVAGYKSSVTKRIRDELNETGIWQRNYHDRIIRNDRELDAIRKYIEANPLNWEKDEENQP